jgi:hypothetical protein
MKWSDLPLEPGPRALRQFAAAWLVFFLALGAQQYFVRDHHRIGSALAAMAVIFGVLGLIRPFAIRWLFVVWLVMAFPIGWVISQVMLAIMFYVLITPIAVLFRLRGRDVLARKPAPEQATFWLPKEIPQDIRSYFRQY